VWEDQSGNGNAATDVLGQLVEYVEAQTVARANVARMRRT
jgi:hypothetical protein